MLYHCANPTCSTPFSLREGQLFQFEIRSISVPCIDDSNRIGNERLTRELAHFWLCGQCSSEKTLILEPSLGLTVKDVSETPNENRKEQMQHLERRA